MLANILACWVGHGAGPILLSSFVGRVHSPEMPLQNLTPQATTAKAFLGPQDPGHNDSGSEVNLEELYQDFWVSVVWV